MSGLVGNSRRHVFSSRGSIVVVEMPLTGLRDILVGKCEWKDDGDRQRMEGR